MTRTPVRVSVEAPAIPTLAVVIVTWNRKALVASVLEALSRQTFCPSRLHVVVVDNSSTDGTLEFLSERFAPEKIIENPTQAAHEPKFMPPTRSAAGTGNRLSLGSLTIVHNHANMGGCGGFNTGFAYISRSMDSGGPGEAPDYVWLVDDDIDLPPDACAQLVKSAEADRTIGLVGSRTVDLADRETTIETTIYFDPATGRMSDEPRADHRLFASHGAWAKTVGATRGKHTYSGLRDVDIVSACSLLARWSLVRSVGFWDYRYFIYCDDADWCLRFARAGHRVVLNLDAVVYHTPWHHKLTPARGYYAQRNILWVIQKLMPARQLRAVTRRWMLSVLKDSLYAACHRRLFHAEIMRRSCDDVVTGRWGKLDFDGPPAQEIGAALDGAHLLGRERSIALVLNRADSGNAAQEFRERVRAFLRSGERERDEPTWIEIVRNDVLGVDQPVPADVNRRVVYAPRAASRLRRQLGFLFAAPSAVVVFDHDCDFPLLRSAWNVHVDRRQASKCQIEHDGLVEKLCFAARWVSTLVRSLLFAQRLGPYTSPGKYG